MQKSISRNENKVENLCLLSQAGKQQFEEEGYTVIKNVFPVEDLMAFRTTLCCEISHILKKHFPNESDLLQLNSLHSISTALLFLRKQNQKYVAQVQRVISRSPEFFRLSSNPVIAQSVRGLLDLEPFSPLYILSNGVVFQNPRDTKNKVTSNFELDWHKDIFYTIPKSIYTHVWAPLLYDVDENIGTLVVCPGSHKEGVGKQQIDIKADYNYRYSLAKEEVNKYTPVSVNVKLGDVLLFDYRLIHRSGYNDSDKVRVTMLGLFHNALSEHFKPVSTYYMYHDQTPEGYFAELFDNDDARSIATEQLVNAGEPKGGV